MRTLSKNYIKSQKGFSLIELILYMGILSILIVALFQLLVAIFDVQLESQSTSAVSSDAKYILNRIEFDISKADTISSPGVGASDQTLVFVDGLNTYTYTLQNDKFMLNVSPAGTSDQLNTYNTKVTNLNFLRLSDIAGDLDSIIVDFTLESETQRSGGVEVESFRTTIGTR